MKFDRISLMVLLVVLAMMLVACGGDDDDGGDVNLSQNLSANVEEFGSVTIYYPEGWAGQTNDTLGTIFFANSQAVLDKMNSDDEVAVASGEVGGTTMLLPLMGQEMGPADALTSFVETMTGGGGGTEANLGEVDEFDARGKSAAIVSGTITEDGQRNGAIVVAVEFDDAIGLLIYVTHPDDVNDYTATARAMAGRFEFSASE